MRTFVPLFAVAMSLVYCWLTAFRLVWPFQSQEVKFWFWIHRSTEIDRILTCNALKESSHHIHECTCAPCMHARALQFQYRHGQFSHSKSDMMSKICLVFVVVVDVRCYTNMRWGSYKTHIHHWKNCWCSQERQCEHQIICWIVGFIHTWNFSFILIC